MAALQTEIVEARKIWDQAPHNAFTDLIRFGDRFVCVFREGKAHVSPDGSLRVISSADGAAWTSEALLTFPGSDLRDAKIALTPDGRLMLSGAAAYPEGGKARHQTFAWFSPDAKAWTEPTAIGDPLLDVAALVGRQIRLHLVRVGRPQLDRLEPCRLAGLQERVQVPRGADVVRDGSQLELGVRRAPPNPRRQRP